MYSTPLVILLGLVSLADQPPDPATLPQPPEILRAGFAAVEEMELRAWLGFLASDELEGRESGQHGYDVAARFCATLFERFGLKPAGDQGTFFQDFDILRSEPDPDTSALEVKDSAGEARFGLAGNLAVWPPADVDWSGPWAFVGFGEGAENDSPSDFRGIDTPQRVVLVLPRPGRNGHESRGAVLAGATRIVIISDDKVKRRMGLESHEWPSFDVPGQEVPPYTVAFVTQKLADRILRTKGLTVDGLLKGAERPPHFDLDGMDLKISVRRKETKLRGRNVVGLLEGADPARRSEAVVIGAHLDHVGQRGSQVFHGADDDASGSCGVIACAKAFAQSPRRPARSVLFTLFAAEEKGLWGSRFFVDHPAVPLKDIITEIQLDMIGRNEEEKNVKPEDRTNKVHVIGSRRESLELQRIINRANQPIGLEFLSSGEQFFGGSDHYFFAEHRIPVAFFYTGSHPDYHKTTDTPDRINFPKMARIVQLSFSAAWDLADREGPLPRAWKL